MSMIYLEDQHQTSAEELAQVKRVESIPYINEVDSSLAVALKFAWQWLRGDTRFEQATSGSTGSPQVINIRREQMMASAQITIEALKLGQRDSSLLCLSAEYVGGKMMIVRSLLANMNMVIVRPTANPLPYVPFLPTFVALVPLQMQTLLDEGASDQLNRMKAIIVGGAPVSTSLEKQIVKSLTVPVYSTYGMTETVSHVALRKITPPGDSVYFNVLGGTAIAKDARGCLKIRGKVTSNKWLATNDLVEIKGGNQFRWLGRYDSVINSGGVKVVPEVIEQVLEPITKKVNFTGRLLVSSLPDQKLGERIVLLMEGHPLSKNAERNILSEAVQQLAKYQVPKAIYYLPQFAETSTGKVQRSRSRLMLLQSLATPEN